MESLNARTDHRRPAGQVQEVLLIVIEHPDLDNPVRLSTDPTERLALEPHLVYGTRSAWRAAPGERAEYQFVIVRVRAPDDTTGATAETELVIEAPDARLGELLISTIKPAIVHMALVTLADPDLPERQWTQMELRSTPIVGADITLTIQRDPTVELPFGAQRATRERMPGLHA